MILKIPSFLILILLCFACQDEMILINEKQPIACLKIESKTLSINSSNEVSYTNPVIDTCTLTNCSNEDITNQLVGYRDNNVFVEIDNFRGELEFTIDSGSVVYFNLICWSENEKYTSSDQVRISSIYNGDE